MTIEQSRNRPPLTEEIFATFGHIISGYASCEILMKALLSAMTSSEPIVIHTLTYGMTGPALLLKIRALNALDPDDKRREQVEALIRRLENTSALRNEIAHGSWTASHRPNAIRPSGMSVKAKGADVVGFTDTEKDYTPEDLSKVADDLVLLGADLMSFLRALGVTPGG